MEDFAKELAAENAEQRERRFAYHEAGHAVVALRTMRDHIRDVLLGITTHNDGSVSAGMMNMQVELSTVEDLNEFEATAAAVACGGIEGELAGCGYYQASGSAADITGLHQMIGTIACEDYFRATGMRRDEFFQIVIERRSGPRIEVGEKVAAQIIREERTLFHAITARLLVERRLTREQLLGLYEELAIHVEHLRPPS
ncbi:MAG: hypothetical protein NUV56_03680 [Candidatus Uhrbacteria bacterium]|nr:hypothetical protein [Candidatus Uhrbacteria bacterium]